jgi:hypothetical protein
VCFTTRPNIRQDLSLSGRFCFEMFARAGYAKIAVEESMVKPKIDGIIEAVRYDLDGHIAQARVYTRRGAVWSDGMVFDRKQLAEQIKQGKRFVTGRRTLNFGSTFETGKPVRLSGEHIVTGESAGQDHLSGIPVF